MVPLLTQFILFSFSQFSKTLHRDEKLVTGDRGNNELLAGGVMARSCSSNFTVTFKVSFPCRRIVAKVRPTYWTAEKFPTLTAISVSMLFSRLELYTVQLSIMEGKHCSQTRFRRYTRTREDDNASLPTLR